jgi:ketosteroid isomerase-like protein
MARAPPKPNHRSVLEVASTFVAGDTRRAVSQDNVELVKRNNEAYNRRDIDAYLDTVSESVSFRSRFSVMDRRTYQGHDDFRRYFEELDGAWSRYEMKLERAIPVGARVVGLFHLYAVGRESGIPVEEEPGVVFTVEAGKVVEIEAYPTQREALESVGL